MNEIYCTPGKAIGFSFLRHTLIKSISLLLLCVFLYTGANSFPVFFNSAKTIHAMPANCLACKSEQAALTTPSVFNNLMMNGSYYLLLPTCQLIGPNRTCESTDRVIFIGTVDMAGVNPTYEFTLTSNTANAVISGTSSGTYTGPVQLRLVPGPGGFFTANGSVTVNFMVSQGGVVVTTCTQTMIIDALPIANAAALSACVSGGNTAVFNLTSLIPTINGGFANDVTFFSDYLLNNPIATPGAYVSTSGVVWARVESATTGCINVAPISLAVVQNPTCIITGPQQSSICANRTGLTFSAPADQGGYAWTVTGGTITSGANTNQITVTAGASGTLSVSLTITSNNGCVSSCNVQIPIVALPVCAITGNNVICAGQSTSFTATGGTSYSWTGPGGFTATTATISNLTVAGTYTVNVSNASGCTSSCSRDLTVNALPVCAITGNNVICAGQSTSFTATGGTSYSWTGPGGFTAATATISNLTVAGTYTVTVTN
ncbi:MAG: hypothetical protein ABIY51_09010, partial [Ferruginibacter sp.]